MSAEYTPPLRAWMVPSVKKRIRHAKPVKEVCAPLESPITPSMPLAVGIASHSAWNVPDWLANEEFVKVELAMAVSEAERKFKACIEPISAKTDQLLSAVTDCCSVRNA